MNKSLEIETENEYCRSPSRLVIWSNEKEGYKTADDLYWRPGKLHTPKRNGRKFKRKTQTELEI